MIEKSLQIGTLRASVPFSSAFRFLVLICVLVCIEAGTAFGQVNPAEIRNAQLKALEDTYFQNLLVLNRGIAAMKFPLPFLLSRYVGLDPQQQAEADSRGIEFVKFHERVVLKITGNYNAAYNATLLTPNQRASRAFTDVVAPILKLVRKEIPTDVACDAIGFEIAYHVRRRTKNSDYEGKEILVVVFDRLDAFTYTQSTTDSARQEILKHSEIYMNGDEFGLALGEREPFDLETHERRPAANPVLASAQGPSNTSAGPGSRPVNVDRALSPGYLKLGRLPESSAKPGVPSPASSQAKADLIASPATAATQVDADRLQAKYQTQLDALTKEGTAKFHLVDYAPPSFVIFHNRIHLQVTLRNPLAFERDSSSIYKRAAQSFDLFLAQQLKALLEKLPSDAEMEGLDITVLNHLAGKPASSSEALEFVLPMKPLRQFVEAEITNQELIDRSVVLVNGVRIALNLQLVE